MRFDVPDGWITEHAAVLTIELAHALVADVVSCRIRIKALQQQPFTRSLQPKLFLVLEWRTDPPNILLLPSSP